MPLVRIDHSDARTNSAAIAAAVHHAIVEVYGIPDRDRFQVITSSARIVAEDAGVGFTRTDPVMIQIFTQRGRSDEAKMRLYAAIAAHLNEVGVSGEDVFIGYVENGPQDWSFGFGRAQYLTGELAVPTDGSVSGSASLRDLDPDPDSDPKSDRDLDAAQPVTESGPASPFNPRAAASAATRA